MSETKNSLTVVERYAIVVSVPISQAMAIIKGQNIDEAEKSFARRRDSEQDYNRKIEYDRIRALLKYAGCYGAKLEDLHNVPNKLEITVSFVLIDYMLDFRDTLDAAMADSVMK